VDFTQTLDSFWVKPVDTCVSSDTVLIREALNLHYDEDVMRLFHCVLTSYSFFFYEQKDRVATSLLHSPVTANFFTEGFQQVALNTSTLKPLLVTLH
jgi:hypothetical protein